jgi:hypothetical protein
MNFSTPANRGITVSAVCQDGRSPVTAAGWGFLYAVHNSSYACNVNRTHNLNRVCTVNYICNLNHTRNLNCTRNSLYYTELPPPPPLEFLSDNSNSVLAKIVLLSPVRNKRRSVPFPQYSSLPHTAFSPGEPGVRTSHRKNGVSES